MAPLKSLVIAVALLAVACGNPNTAPTPAPPANPGPSDSGPGPHRMNTIFLSNNYGQEDSSVDAACVGTAMGDPQRIKRKHLVRWQVEDNPNDPCPSMNRSAVKLVFEKAIWVAPGGMLTNELVANGSGQISGRLTDSGTVAPNKFYKYYVVYQNKKASPDPKVDVMGDCPMCTQ
jgi:hypothetical protein